MGKSQIDLFSLFNQVSKTLKTNQPELNKADSYNNDHGDHMVEIFEVIKQAMQEKKSADPADQLEYAAALLRRKSQSGSAKIYAKGLSQASKQFTGQEINMGNIMPLLQTILGGSAKTAPKSTSAASGAGDLLGSLLTGMAGGKTSEASQGLDLADLLGAGMSYMQAKQSGKGDMEALVGALVGGSQMGSSPHRAQSSELVANTILQGLSAMIGK
ncbi:MAG TPA: hypothetical protein G4N92_03805 [Anaerolineae bacterium]|nr:hypothetical protein [Anaerolineae bacterium]